MNPSVVSQQQNSDDDDGGGGDDDDNESVSTRSNQAISLTSFVQATTNDSNLGTPISLRQLRQRMNTNDQSTTWQTRTRYGRRSTVSYRDGADDDDTHRPQQMQSMPSSSRVLSASDDDGNDHDDDDDDDDEIGSNSKRNRIERSDRRISSVNRPNYKIESDDEMEPVEHANTNGTGAIAEHHDETEPNDKVKRRKLVSRSSSSMCFSCS